MVFKPKVVKQLTFPQLKLVNDATVYVKTLSEIYQGKEIEQKEGEQKRNPPFLMQVTDLETGTNCEMITNAVLKSSLEESFPNNSYVGLCFMITKRPKEDGKPYNKFELSQIEDPAPAQENKTDKKSAAK